MSEAQQRAAELARFYFRKIAESSGWTWDGDNDVEVELMVGNIIEAAAERLRPQLDDALNRIHVLEDRLPDYADEDDRARAEEELAREGMETAMSASERAEYDQASEAYLDAAEEARDLADDADDYRGWLP